MKQLIMAVALLSIGFALAGCGSAETTVTKEQENTFRNPPKEPPAAAAEGMRKGMEEAARKQQEKSGK